MIQLQNVLVATDFSETSDVALAYGRELARTFGAALHVLHVVDDVTSRYALDGSLVMPVDLQEDLEASARAQLDRTVGDDDRRELRAKMIHRTSNTPAEAIVDYARKEGVGIIVIGTHGRRAIAHLLLGSVAERVVRTAPCPVLTVRHPEREFVAPDALVPAAKT